MADHDVVVVGSGFGGSVAALRLAEKGYRVCVLEAGRRFGPNDFPRSSWRVRRYLWAPRFGCRGIQRLTLLDHALVLSGAGVGGGSLVYANTLYEPQDAFWDDPHWPQGIDWRAQLEPCYALARRTLGATRTPFETPADTVVRRVAERMGAGESFRLTDVAVFFGEPGVEVPDPYFDGAGPPRTGCTRCGGCMVGCRHGAKNTLDRNYLWLAERLGVEIRPEHEVSALVPLEHGWEVRVRGRPSLRAGQVVLAAGVLGTTRLLLGLPEPPPGAGDLVRTNSEVIGGATAKRAGVDHSIGVAIGSSFQADERTRIEPVRYPRGSNAMGLLGTLLVDGGGRIPRPLRLLGLAARRPLAFLRSLSVYRWSERTIIVLVMQARDNALRVELKRGRLRSRAGDGEPPPSYLPVANEAIRLVAQEIGGEPGSSITEILLGRPVTAHILGGAALGTALDSYHRVPGLPGLHVVDGSAICANPGVNPALTIAAHAERALSYWPRRGEADSRPPLGLGSTRRVS